MSSANLTMGINGVDKTGAAFNSVKWKAKATGLSIKNALGGALAFAGAYFGFSKIKEGISELGHLSDIAMKTSTSVDELTKTATALNVLGIQNMGVDQLAKSFDYMQKTTGRTGMSGFLETIGELGKITDTSERAQAAMKIFGRSGMEFMPLINAADKGTEALEGVIAAMPGVSKAAADAGDAAADSMTIFTEQIKSLWLDALGVIARNIDENIEGGSRQAAAAAAAHFEHWVKSTWRRIVAFGANCGIVFQAFATNWIEVLSAVGEYLKDLSGAIAEFAKGMWNTTWDDWRNGRWFGDAPESFSAAMEKALDKVGPRLANSLELGNLIDADTSDLDRTLEDKLKAIKNLKKNMDDASNSTGSRQGGTKPTDDKKGDLSGPESASKPTVKNDLIMAGSNEARKLQILGPQLQSETKKQTGLLQKIADNTKSTADNTEHDADNPQGVID